MKPKYRYLVEAQRPGSKVVMTFGFDTKKALLADIACMLSRNARIKNVQRVRVQPRDTYDFSA